MATGQPNIPSGQNRVSGKKDSVTARKYAEQAMRRQAELLRLSFDAIFVWRIGGVIESWNRGAEQLYGYSESEALGRVTHELLRTTHSTPWPETEARLRQYGNWEGELRHITKQGRAVTVASRHQLIAGADGAELILETNRDITEIKRAAETSARLAAIIQSSKDAIISKDLDGIVSSWNPSAERIFGYSAEEIIGQPITLIIPPERRAEEAEFLERLRRGEHIDHYETVRVHKSGTRIDVSVSISPVYDAAGKLFAISKIVREITERKQAEQALRESEERLRALVTASSEVMYRMSPDWSELRQLRGGDFIADSEEPSRTWLQDYIYPDDRARVTAVVNEAIQTKSMFEMEHRVLRVDGTVGWTFSRAIPLLDADGDIIEWFGAATDITERKRAEQALIRSEKLASVGRMAATIAHEISNPLSSAMNALFLARTDPALPECVKSDLNLAEQELNRISHITKQTLGFYKEVGKPTAVDLPGVLDSLLDLYGPKLRDKKVSVQRSYRSSVGIRANEGEIRQIVSNVIANSIDALPEGGKLHVRFSGPQVLSGHRRMVRLTIADDGEGIARANLKRIFEPFFTTKESIGTGLGLWVVSELVKKHEGRLRLRSGLGKGTVLTLWLPVERRNWEQRRSA